jgi:hypothetical protein
VKGKAGRGAGIVVGTIMMAKKSGAGIMLESGAGAGAGAEIATGKGGGTEEGTMTMRGVESATVTAATGEERNDRAFCSSLTLLLPIFVAVDLWYCCY